MASNSQPITCTGENKKAKNQKVKTQHEVEKALFNALADDKLSHICTWSNKGKAFVIINQALFVKSILFNITGHRSFPTFVR